MKEKVMCFFLLLSVAAAVSCKNIFHDMTKSQFPVDMPLLPQVEYTYPGNGDTGIPVNNRFIIVTFNKDMDFTSLDENTFTIARADGTGPDSLPSPPAIFNERIIILSPDIFLPDSWYRVKLMKNITDAEGRVVHAGYSWRFKTHKPDEEGYMDLTAPTVTITPANGNFVRAQDLKEITAGFSENINPTAMTMTVEKVGSPPVPVDGTVNYAVSIVGREPRWTATFTPSVPIEKGANYRVRVSGVRDLAGNEQVPDPAESVFRTDSIEVYLQDAKNINYGAATFGDVSGRGYPLLDENAEYLDNPFTTDGDSMTAVFDSGTSGPMAAGKSVRIVAGGKNIMTGIGPGNVVLEPVYKNLSGGIISPPGNQCYVDPRDGRFVLPRPSYWSKLDSSAEIENPQIKEESPYMATMPTAFPAGKWGNCMQFYSSFSFQAAWALYPFGTKSTLDRGTISLWFQMYSSGYPYFIDYCLYIYFGGPNNYLMLHGNNCLYLVVDGITVRTLVMNAVNTLKWHHLYATWDRNDTTGNKMRIFIDKKEMTTLTTSWKSGYFHLGFYTGLTPYLAYYIMMDNLKIWKHVVSADPEWEFNENAAGNGQGREEALHYIYGPDADPSYDYSPRLVVPDSGVGYYY